MIVSGRDCKCDGGSRFFWWVEMLLVVVWCMVLIVFVIVVFVEKRVGFGYIDFLLGLEGKCFMVCFLIVCGFDKEVVLGLLIG